MTMTELAPPIVKPSHGGTDGIDEGKVAHYVRKDLVTDAYVLGTELTALCGVRFIPERDPERYPVCSECKALKEAGIRF